MGTDGNLARVIALDAEPPIANFTEYLSQVNHLEYDRIGHVLRLVIQTPEQQTQLTFAVGQPGIVDVSDMECTHLCQLFGIITGRPFIVLEDDRQYTLYTNEPPSTGG